MMHKPNLPDETIISCLRDQYGVMATEVACLPLGADVDTAVYRVTAEDTTPYFLKARRRSAFIPSVIEIPQFLHQQGIASIIPPITNRTGQGWTALPHFAVTLYPYVAGHNGFEGPLSDHQWIELGAALKSVHEAKPPLSLSQQIPHETYSPQWRARARKFQLLADQEVFNDPVAAEVAALLRTRRRTITDLVDRAEHYATMLREQRPAHVLCHADFHAGNVLLGDDDRVHIIDWDTVMLAPKEHDLMFIGGRIGGVWNEDREGALFYEGYGMTEIDPVALAYYRYERIVEDIAAFCDELLLSTGDMLHRTEAWRFLRAQFEAHDVIEIAYRSDLILTGSA